MPDEVFNYKKDLELSGKVDVLVVGGGPAGISASIAAARNGREVLLVEKMGCLGGMGTSGLVPCFAPLDDGERVLADGICVEVIDELEECGGVTERLRDGNLRQGDEDTWLWIQYNHEKLKIVYDDMIGRAGVNVKLFTTLVDIICGEGRLETAVLHGPDGLHAVRAEVFIDATGDAELAFRAGVPYEVGDEQNSIQPPTLCSVFAGVDWDRYEAFLEETGQTNNLEKTKIEGIEDGVFTTDDYHLSGARRTGERLAGMNVGHVFDIDPVSTEGISRGVIEGRKIVQEYLNFYREYVPGFEGAELVTTAPLLGIRETRRIRGEYELDVEDFMARRDFPDEIGRYNYPVDIHPSRPGKSDFEEFEAEWQRDFRYSKGESYGIPLRSLIASGVDNLLVGGRCISADKKMQGSIRVMPCCFITGQAAGTAAAVACSENPLPLRELDAEKVRSVLRRDGAYIS